VITLHPPSAAVKPQRPFNEQRLERPLKRTSYHVCILGQLYSKIKMVAIKAKTYTDNKLLFSSTVFIACHRHMLTAYEKNGCNFKLTTKNFQRIQEPEAALRVSKHKVHPYYFMW